MKANSLVNDNSPENELFQVIDIGDFLHPDIKSQMHQKDSTRIMIVSHNNAKPDAFSLLDGKVGDLWSWAEENGFDEANATATFGPILSY